MVTHPHPQLARMAAVILFPLLAEPRDPLTIVSLPVHERLPTPRSSRSFRRRASSAMSSPAPLRRRHSASPHRPALARTPSPSPTLSSVPAQPECCWILAVGSLPVFMPDAQTVVEVLTERRSAVNQSVSSLLRRHRWARIMRHAAAAFHVVPGTQTEQRHQVDPTGGVQAMRLSLAALLSGNSELEQYIMASPSPEAQRQNLDDFVPIGVVLSPSTSLPSSPKAFPAAGSPSAVLAGPTFHATPFHATSTLRVAGSNLGDAAASAVGIHWLHGRCRELLQLLRGSFDVDGRTLPRTRNRPLSPPQRLPNQPQAMLAHTTPSNAEVSPTLARPPSPFGHNEADAANGKGPDPDAMLITDPYTTLQAAMAGLASLGTIAMASLRRRARVRAQALHACLPRPRLYSAEVMASPGSFASWSGSTAGDGESSTRDDWLGFECEVETLTIGAGGASATGPDEEEDSEAANEENEEEQEEEQETNEAGFGRPSVASIPAVATSGATRWRTWKHDEGMRCAIVTHGDATLEGEKAISKMVMEDGALGAILCPRVLTLAETRAYYELITQSILLLFSWRLNDERADVQQFALDALTKMARFGTE